MSLGVTISQILQPGFVIGLKGPLGAGKTTLVKGIAQGLGIAPDQVTSPTYSIAQLYETPAGNLCHCDLYRLSGEDDFYGSGIDEMLDESIALVEWPERLPLEIQRAPSYGEITIERVTEQERHFSITLPGSARNTWTIPQQVK